MQALDIEETKTSNTSVLSPSAQERRVTFFIFAASLGFLSTGYHLSVLNSSAIFLWLGCSFETDFYSFKAKCDALYILVGFLIAALISLNKIKFQLDLKFLKAADLIMIMGTLTAFTIFSETYQAIQIGRVISGIAAGINATITLSFVREVQFHLSTTLFKSEKRRIFMDIFFALGIFLGFLPSQVIPEIAAYGEYVPRETEDFDTGRPDFYTCCLLCVVPIVASVMRTALLCMLGDVTPPQYAPAFTDEGLTSVYEEEEDDMGRLYMIKFKESRSLLKLLREPYRLRLGLCCLLVFSQMWSGIVIFIVNPLQLTLTLKRGYVHENSFVNVQDTINEFGAFYFGSTLLCSLIFSTSKVPRRPFLYIGFISATIISLILSIMIIADKPMYIKELIYGLCCSVSIGIGPAMELFHDEVLPAKGMQFLAAFKWLLMGLFGIASQFTLRFLQIYIIQTVTLVVQCALIVYIVYELLPETVGVEPEDIHNLFEYEYEGQIDEPLGGTKQTTTPVLSPTQI